MFCKNCGKEVLEKAVVCLSCGGIVNEVFLVSPKEKDNYQEWSLSAFIGYLILGVLLPFVGFIIGIVGITKEAKRTQGIYILVASIVSGLVCAIWIPIMIGYVYG